MYKMKTGISQINSVSVNFDANWGKLGAKLDKNEIFQDSSKIAGGGKVDTEIPKIKSVFENFEV